VQTPASPSRLDDLLSLSQTSHLTLPASFIEQVCNISPHRFEFIPLELQSLTFVMDIPHLAFNTELDPGDHYSDPGMMEVVIGKAIFQPDHGILRFLDLHLLAI
jgi:hypothetical protein